jgi:hypothetical protein
MASKFKRGCTWWIKFTHPDTKQRVRQSLETHDEARAELLRERIELEVALLEPRLRRADLPDRIRKEMGLPAFEKQFEDNRLQPSSSVPLLTLPALSKPRVALDEAVKVYLNYIQTDNAPHHAANKVSMLRRFLGRPRVEKLMGSESPLGSSVQKSIAPKPFFTGQFLDELSAPLVQQFIEGLPVAQKTKRHYREFFHHFFEACLKFELYQPTNWHRPNPISALPGYVTRNRRIIFLGRKDVDVQLEVLRGHPEFRIAAALMIHAGLRRSETIWLKRDAISEDLSYLSVLNRFDDDEEIESSLKTGERSVTILPPLRSLLREYLPNLKGDWLVPPYVPN